MRGDHEHDTPPSGARRKLVLPTAQRAAAAACAELHASRGRLPTAAQGAAEEQRAVEAQAATEAEAEAKAARQLIEQRRLAAVRQVEAILCERFPAVFCLARVPLAIGIYIVKSARDLATQSPPGR